MVLERKKPQTSDNSSSSEEQRAIWQVRKQNYLCKKKVNFSIFTFHSCTNCPYISEIFKDHRTSKISFRETSQKRCCLQFSHIKHIRVVTSVQIFNVYVCVCLLSFFITLFSTKTIPFSLCSLVIIAVPETKFCSSRDQVEAFLPKVMQSTNNHYCALVLDKTINTSLFSC